MPNPKTATKLSAHQGYKVLPASCPRPFPRLLPLSHLRLPRAHPFLAAVFSLIGAATQAQLSVLVLFLEAVEKRSNTLVPVSQETSTRSSFKRFLSIFDLHTSQLPSSPSRVLRELQLPRCQHPNLKVPTLSVLVLPSVASILNTVKPAMISLTLQDRQYRFPSSPLLSSAGAAPPLPQLLPA